MTLELLGWSSLLVGGALIGYAFVGYPVLLALFLGSGSRSSGSPPDVAGVKEDPAHLPPVAVIVPVYNEAHQIHETLGARPGN